MPAISSPNSSLRWPLLLTAVVALLIAAAYTFYFVFSRSMSLDEGYLMITVQGFNSGHALYDSVFTQYGPFYYFYEWFLHSALAVPLTHDATRLLCLAHWLVASILLGGAAWRLTRSTLAAIFVALLAVVHLSSVANEPGHPQEIVVLLLALGAVVAGREVRGRWTLEILALITALLFFTKINVGVFSGFALLLALRCHSEERFARGFWNWVLLLLCAGLPWVLMRQHIAAPWCRNFSAVTACAAVATLLMAQRVSIQRTVSAKNYFTIGAAFVVAATLLLGLSLLTGTSWHGLIDGLISTPMKMPRVALLPIALPNAAVFGALASMAVAALVVWKRNEPRISALVVALKVAFAIAGAFCLISDAKNQLGWLLPWVWLVAVPATNDDELKQCASFPRVFLCLVAAWQSLQAYPIAGTQVTLATFLLVLAYGVCLSDALSVLAKIPRVQSRLAALTPGVRTLAPALAGMVLLFVFTNHWCQLSQVRRGYARLRPLDLPGSRLVRMDDETVEMYQALARYLAAECDTFVSYPGINSLYFWADKKPPTQINSTGWGQLNFAQQEKILGSLRKTPRSKLVVVEAMMQSWHTSYADPIRPLVRFVDEECRPVRRIGRCLIFELKPASEVTLTP